MTRRALEADYVFGRFRLSADGTLLLRDGGVVSLAPKVLQTLLVLVEHAGEVVKKADLIEAVWPNSFVEDTGLTRNISLLRQALDDDGERFVVTVSRIGYRFAAAVARVEGRGAPAHREARGQRAQPIVGRDRELRALLSALDAAKGGVGGLLAVTGEPGIGKTTIVDRFLHEVAETCRIGSGRCSERLAGAESHLPILEVLDELTADPAVKQALRRIGPTWARYLAPQGDNGDDTGIVTTESAPASSPERLMRELTIFLEDTSRQQPLVIFIDDLHWADVSTIDVLAHLAPRLDRMRVLVVVTYRQHEMLQTQHPFARLRGELIARRHLSEVQVSLLGLDDVREYVRMAFGDAPGTADLATLVFQKTEGNPLFMRDLVRYFQEQGRAPGTRPGSDVPQSLRGLIDRTLQALHPTTRQLLSIAAVQGYEFDSATIARVSGAAAADVEERLRSADDVHALVRLEREHAMPDGTFSLVYRFVHVLYQDALYGSIAPSRRSGWARELAEALLASHAGVTDTIAGQLAVLFETGREFWQASHYFLVTSRNAARLFAFAQASELASRGLQCLRSVASGEPRDLARRELDLTFARLVPLATLLGYGSAEVAQLTRRVVELAEELGDRTAAAAALGATWIVSMVRGECSHAKDAGLRLAAIGRETHSDVLLVNAYMHAQIACHHRGEFREAQEFAAAVLPLAPNASLPERCISIFDPVVASLAESSRNAWITGHLRQSLADCNAAVALAREVRHPDSLAFAWLFHAWIHGYHGDWTTCIASADTGKAIAREVGSVQTLAWNQCVHGWALARVGDWETGRSEVSAGIEASKPIMGQVALPQFIAMIAEVLLLKNDAAAAEAWLRQAIDFESSHDDLYFTAEVHRLTAICLAARGEAEGAVAHLRHALEVARSQGATFFELRAALNLAEHNLEEAREALRAILARFPEPEPWSEVNAARRLVG